MTRHSGFTRVIGILAAFALIVAACGDEAEDAPAAEEEPQEVDADEEDAPADEQWLIGVSFPNSTGTLYTEMTEGIQALADELGVEVIFNYAEEDQAQQLDDVDTLLARGVDAILISPIDFDGAQPAYETARDQGVPIISVARTTDPALQESFVGAPWEDFGVQIAEWTCDDLGGQGQVAMLMGPAGASFVDDMERGYKGYMGSDCPDIEIVFETHVVPMIADQTLPVAQDALSAHPDLDAIYSQLDDMVPGVNTVLAEQDRLGDVIVTGFDGTPDAFELIRQGEQAMTIALHPYRWGQLGLRTVVDYLQGEDVPEFVTIETTLLDGSNIGDFTDEELR